MSLKEGRERGREREVVIHCQMIQIEALKKKIKEG
jgi:hypothetical protein